MFQIPSLVASERLDRYPSAIFADSGGAPNAIGLAQGKASSLEKIWFTVKPKELYKFSYYSLFVEPLKKGRWPILGAEAIFSEKALNEVIDRETDFDKVLRSPIRIWVAVGDLISGEVLWFSNHDKEMTAEFFRAVILGTMRIPVFWKPVACSWKEREYQFVDPGLITNIPVRKAIEQGFSNIVVIETVPKKFSPINKLDMIGEIDIRYSEMAHLYESDGDLRWLSNINANLKVLENVEKIITDGDVSDEVRKRVKEEHGNYMFSGKRPVNVCRLNPPAKLSIFQKVKRKAYGAPSTASRFELLGAGIVAAEEVIMPFLKERGMVPSGMELPVDWF
ncbi:MAG: hypothetical protein Q7R91_01245 [bacterium]|nr:hypothetical protein [bacterium]